MIESPRVFGAVLVIAFALGVDGALAQDADLTFNQKLKGLISDPLDTDTVGFEEVEGSKLTIVVKRDKGSVLTPAVTLLNGTTLAPINVGTALKQTSKSVTIKNFAAPFSGEYIVQVGSLTGATGGYTVSVTGKPPTKFNAVGDISVGGEIDEIEFVARKGGLLSGLIAPTAPTLTPVLIEIEDPSGALVAIAGFNSLAANSNKLTLKNVALPRTGTYVLRLTGLNASTGTYSSKLSVKAAKPEKGTVLEPGLPSGGSGGGGGGSFTLSEVQFGRGILSIDGLSMQVVSPLTTLDTNPISGVAIDGTLQKLFPQVDLDERLEFGLGAFFTPPIVPRNAVLELVFSKPIDVDSLKLDADRRLTANSPVQLAVNGQGVFAQVFVAGSRVILNPVVADEVGFPASPVVVNALGKGVASTTGAATLTLNPVGENKLKSQAGGVLKPRSDLLGSTAAGGTAIGFNPGNSALDFIDQGNQGAVDLTFNGFLPDVKAPRLVREYRFDGTFMYANGDSIGVNSITLRTTVGFSNLAKNGKGEWADGIIRLRPQGPNKETVVILASQTTNLGGGLFQTTFQLATGIKVPLADGQKYELARAEFYEPDPGKPLDPIVFDPANPLILENEVINNFLELKDENGDVVELSQGMPSKGTVTVRFSEPMELSSFLPYETFYVTDDPAPSNPGTNNIGRVIPSEGGRAMTFAPDRAIQFGPQAGTFERVGFGPDPRALLLHLQIVPPPDVLIGLLGEAGYEEFVKDGQRGLTDLAGRAVAVDPTTLTSQQPVVNFQIPVETLGDLSLDNLGAVVLRFRGAPVTAFAPDGSAGVTYRDVPPELCGPNGNVFGPHIPDINLFSNGFFSGAPVAFFQKIHDDFNPPLDGQFSAFAFGSSTPIGGFSVIGGARFQHVYRAQDCSPDAEGLAGTFLDLRQVNYAPSGGNVVNTTIPDFQVHGGHTRYVPITAQGNGIPLAADSGLGFLMGGTHNSLGVPNSGTLAGNYNATNVDTGVPFERKLLYGTEVSPDAYTGGSFVIDGSNLFTPAGTTRAYHPIPHVPFTNTLPYDNGVFESVTLPNGSIESGNHSLLLEYRVRGSAAGTVATTNGFTLAVGILTTALPRFRVYTIGAGCGSCTFQGTCFTGMTSAISPPFDPDTIRNAAGPNPNPPGMPCDCPRHPVTGNVLPPGAPNGCVLTGNATTITELATTLNGALFNDLQHNYGDNSRYYMVFDYVKKTSFVRSPWIRAQPGSVTSLTWLAPIFDPPLTNIPTGTTFDIRFRTSVDGDDSTASALLPPSAMVDEDNALNQGLPKPFIQFEVTIEGNASSQLVPVIDTLVVPLRK
jgi:hypothetical protein